MYKKLYKHKNSGINNNEYEKSYKFDKINIIYFVRKIKRTISEYDAIRNNTDAIIRELNKINNDIDSSEKKSLNISKELERSGEMDRDNNAFIF